MVPAQGGMPLWRGRPHDRRLRRRTRRASQFGRKTMNVAKIHPLLLAEDDENDVFFMRRAFLKAQIANPLHRVKDGEEAISYLRGEGEYANREKFPMPHLLLLDLKMPRRNGFEVIAWVRSHPSVKRLPIVVLTSSQAGPGHQPAPMTWVRNTYLVKPVNFEGLVEMMKALNFYWLMLAERPSLD